MLGEWTVFLVSEDLDAIMPSVSRRGAIGMTLFCFLFITGALFEVRRVSAELDAITQRPHAGSAAELATRNASRNASGLLLAASTSGVPLEWSGRRERDFLEPADVAERAEEYVDRSPLLPERRRSFGARRHRVRI
ncbi:hypothetical protein HPB50_024613 [Hyalomma asiaticum]|uniref:Uncharacterized protein n=1 Tax=Hyalomma asiaticum TaxID=266040 RepID=A0ACB7SZN4_HYAAI|nr:hypothetical protein HPB50_024613 [Hyalomma asiaticum]